MSEDEKKELEDLRGRVNLMEAALIGLLSRIFMNNGAYDAVADECLQRTCRNYFLSRFNDVFGAQIAAERKWRK